MVPGVEVVAATDERPVAGEALEEAQPPFARPWLEHVTMLAALLWWAWPLTSRVGGRGAGALAIGALIGLPALIVQRPWRRLPRSALALACVVSLAALLVCFLTPVGFARADSAVTYVYSVALAVTGWCYARTPRRRELLVGAILFAGMREFAGSFFAWWGHGTSDVPMNGDFPWRNSYAAFLVAPGVMGAAVAVRNTGALRMFGWVAAPLCLAGIVFSTSRAAIAVVAAGWLAIGVLVARKPTKARLVRWFMVGAVSLGFVYVLAGPPVFPHRTSPFTAIQQRTTSGETLAANGHYRLDFWHEAIDAFESRPVTGTGYQELAAVSYGRSPADWPRAPLAHNSYLQPLADGGLLLGVPFLLACLIAAGLFAARILRVVVRDPGEDLVIPVAAVAGLLLMAHAGIDFDWSQPSNLALAGLTGALALAPLRPRAKSARSTHSHRVLAGVLVGLLGFSAYAAHHWDNANDLRSRPITTANAKHLVGFAGGPLRDYRLAVQVLSRYDAGMPVASPVVREALALTEGIAAEDRGIAFVRATALAQLGEPAAAVQVVDQALGTLRDSAPGYWVPAGTALIAAGDRARGRVLLVQATDFAARRGSAPIYWAAVTALLKSDGSPVPRSDACAVSAGIERFGGVPSDPSYRGLGHVDGCPALAQPAG